MSETSPGFDEAMEAFRRNDPNPMRQHLGLAVRCLDCGEADMLDHQGVCPSCRTEREIDQAQHFAEEA